MSMAKYSYVEYNISLRISYIVKVRSLDDIKKSIELSSTKLNFSYVLGNFLSKDLVKYGFHCIQLLCVTRNSV